MKVFVDTSAFVSLLVKQDFQHDLVTEKHQGYLESHAIFLTSDYVLDELYTHLVYDLPANIVTSVIAHFDQKINTKDLRVLPIDETVFSQAKAALLKFSEHKISFTDCNPAVLFKELNLDEIFTLDSDFKKLRLPVSFPKLK